MTPKRSTAIRQLIKLMIALGTLARNFLLVYVLLYDPLSQFLIDKDKPYNIPSSKTVTSITFLIIALIIATSVILLFKIVKRQQIFIYSPIFSLAVLITIFSASYFSISYPSSTSQYEKDGYYYKIEIWWDTPDHNKTYKLWKSVFPYDGKTNPDELKYKLDSLSVTKDR